MGFGKNVTIAGFVSFSSRKRKTAVAQVERQKLTLAHFDWKFKSFVVIAMLFAVGNSRDVFLILGEEQVGIPTITVPVAYLLFNLVYSLTSVTVVTLNA